MSSNHTSHKSESGQHATAVAAEPVTNTTRYLIIAVLVVASFFGAYKFADASRPSTPGAPGALAALGGGGGGGCGMSGGSGGGGGCCGGGGGPATTGAAEVSGGVQKITVDTSRGYNPSNIELKAGVPAEITFGAAQGCLQVVYSAELGFQEDLSTGPKTVKLPALKAGTYNFACGMDMARGTIVVK